MLKLSIYLSFIGLFMAIIFPIKYSIGQLNVLIVSPFLYHSHHQLDIDMARTISRDRKHRVHVFVPVREVMDCDKVNESAKKANFIVECYFVESTKGYWAEGKDGIIRGFPDFYKKLFADKALMTRLKEEKFDVGLAQLHFFSVLALKMYSLLGIEKHIGMIAGSLSPNHLKMVGLLDAAIKNSVPPVNWGPFNTKIGDSAGMTDERKKEIKKIYEKSTAVREIDDEDERKAFEEMNALKENLVAIFVNSRKELEWDGGKWMENPRTKLAFIGGFNLEQNKEKKRRNVDKNAAGNKPVILLSFGTLIDTPKRLKNGQIYAIKWALQQFPQFHFIWKVSEKEKRLNRLTPAKYSKHIEITKWIDQREKLANPKTVGFISHCGRNSELETIVNGVPLICVPFEVDQFYNAETLAQKGASISVDIQNKFGPKNFANVLEKLLGQMAKWKIQKKGAEKEQIDKNNEEMRKIEEFHKKMLENFDILHKKMNRDIGEDGMAGEIFNMLDGIEQQLNALKKVSEVKGKQNKEQEVKSTEGEGAQNDENEPCQGK